MIEPNVDWINIFRAIGLAEMALLLGLLLKHRTHTLTLRLCQLFVACVICYLVSEIYRPVSIAERPPFVWYALVSIAMAIPALYWGLARAVFVDGFVWGKKEWWVTGLYELIAVIFLAADYYWKFELEYDHVGFMLFPILMQIGLSLWTLYIIVESWRSDLLEKRRRLRLLAALVVGSFTLFALIFELTGINADRGEATLMIHTMGIALLGFIALLALGHIDIQGLYSLTIEDTGAKADKRIESPKAETAHETSQILTDWESHLSHIQQQRLYALDNMTIAKLADMLSVPQYRLRKQISHSTDFKNFNQFLNHFRIEEAAQRLLSREERDVPILTIALDVGFRSLPSFNRCFKERYEMTPSEYRKSDSEKDAE